MPWLETQKMDQRLEFAMKAMNCGNFTELCQQYGISRKTGYKWKKRFIDDGFGGLADQSTKPKSHSEELPEEVVCRIINLKQAHLKWGPRKIHNLYQRKYGEDKTPSESSFKRVLEKAGYTKKRKKRRASEGGGRISTDIKAEKPNQVWTVDFKGWWFSAKGEKVEPLTVRDEYSKMVLELRAVPNSRTETIMPLFEKLFEAHGLPDNIRSDNGPPFATAKGLLGLSKLSVWWLALGIDLTRGRPGCPQDNGAHERMHLDVRNELESGKIGRDQAAFDEWRHEFNNQRPHEALNMAFPSELYKPSDTIYTGTPDQIDYDGKETRRVAKSGSIRYNNDLLSISTTMIGWDVALVPIDKSGEVEVWFTNILIGHINHKTSSFTPIKAK